MNKNKWFLNGGRGSGRTLRLLCEAYENKIADLEKENAELKEDNSEWEKASDKWKSVYELTNKQLTKAKEIIKIAIEGIKHWGIVGGTERPFEKQAELEFNLFLEKAEQFIKDSEVEK